ncbi:MAG: hypothetical protein FD165_533 [Gammaproteobacteria bacterium]|nr:MAG: hypothetical protein FD165_533 [Gammaproteobacteria bacterium]TND02205.1 MAG: hypothetical protein FD120_2369 [Gammaproteobacteria bacterium]
MNVALVLIRLTLTLLVLFAIFWLVTHRDILDIGVLQARLEDAGTWASVSFIFLYTISVVSCVPASILTVAGGIVFGPLLGTTYNMAGALAGATLAFFISRYMASEWVRARLGARLTVVLESAEAEGWRFVAFTRLVPVFPFCVISYALGVTRVQFSHYLAATMLFVLPGMFAFTYAGHAGRAVLSGDQDASIKVWLALGLIAVLIFLPRFLRRIRMHRKSGNHPGTTIE